MMLLEGLGIPFDAIDITKPGNDEQRVWMREHAVREGNNEKQPPLPPQFFYEEDYLGVGCVFILGSYLSSLIRAFGVKSMAGGVLCWQMSPRPGPPAHSPSPRLVNVV